MPSFFNYKLLGCVILASVGLIFSASQAQAATKTICASGCDYTTINAAFVDSIVGGDVLQVVGSGGSPYAASSETWPVAFPNASTTLECTGGAVVSQTSALGQNRLYLATSSTVQNCTFGNVELATQSAPTPASGIRIIGNTFSTTATSTINFAEGATQFSVLNNTNINFLNARTTTTHGVIQDNTFYGRMAGQNVASMLALSASSSQLQIIGNTFSNRSSAQGISTRLIVLNGEYLTFATNTINYSVDFSGGDVDYSLLSYASGTNYIGGNFVDTPSSTTQCVGIGALVENNAAFQANYTFYRNTIRRRGACSAGVPLWVRSPYNRADIALTLNTNYNLIHNAGTSTSARPAIEYSVYAANSLTQSNDYNGAYGFSRVVQRAYIGGASSDISGSHSKTSIPFLKVFDADTTNDLETAAFSDYLDVNGTVDIGATSAARRATATVSQLGTIDYSTVDATSTYDINHFIRSGDSVTLAAGSYAGFSVSSTSATTTITIAGAGASTIVTAASGQDALRLMGVTTSTLSGLVLTGAGTGSRTYTTTKLLYSFGSDDYADSVGPFGIAGNTMLVLTSGSCSIAQVTADGYNLTSLTGSGTAAVHVALVDIMGFKLTFLVPDTIAASESALETVCTSIGLNVDAFIDEAFTPSAGVYTYNSAAAVSAGATLLGGVTTPPRIDDAQEQYAGLRFTNSSGWTVTNVSSTANALGIAFGGTTVSSTIQDSYIGSSTAYDVLTTANATNTLDNVTFTRTSSSVSGSGTILVKYKARVRALRSSNSTAISGARATSTAINLTDTALGLTDGSGYTSYVSLPSHTITSVSSALTNGGYNPYTFSASFAGYSASTTAATTLSSRNQLVTLSLISASIPTAPSLPTSTSLTTTGATVLWMDNSDDEDSFAVDSIAPLTGQSYPGTVSYVTSATSTSLSSLTSGETYAFRVAAVNTNGTSSYAASSNFTLPAATPGAPQLTALSRTSLSIGLDTNSNATSVQYALYSSTLGGYLNALGAVSLTSVWQTSSTWGTLTISNLTCNTTYSFVAIARNTSAVETATSSASTVTTSACATTSGGGGGGAVGGGGGGGSIQVFFPSTTAPVSSPAPISSTPVAPSPTTPAAPTVSASSPAPVPTETLTTFLEQGTNPASQALGRGEREAILRDLQEVLGRSEQNIPVSDLARVANGEIPRTRNLTYERSMVPRALATFRTIFGHAPTFQDADENLAWNTLLYRIRFTRDLTAEREGITDFRRIFRTTPQSPFQWSVVRVLGYIR